MPDRLTRRSGRFSMPWFAAHSETGAACMSMKDFDRNPVSIGEKALWDERLGVFLVKVQGNRDVGSLVILRSADMPISHLDSTLPRKQTKLGQFLREQLELAVNAAISSGSHEIGEGLSLLAPDQTPQD